MQTRREYLVGLGLAKDGRGKLSNAAHAAIAEAVGNGVQFSDLQDRPVVVKRAEKPESPQERTDNFADGFKRYPDDQKFEGISPETSKRVVVNVRQGCKHSRYSIQGCDHTGETHTVLVGSGVWMDVTPIGE